MAVRTKLQRELRYYRRRAAKRIVRLSRHLRQLDYRELAVKKSIAAAKAVQKTARFLRDNYWEPPYDPVAERLDKLRQEASTIASADIYAADFTEPGVDTIEAAWKKAVANPPDWNAMVTPEPTTPAQEPVRQKTEIQQIPAVTGGFVRKMGAAQQPLHIDHFTDPSIASFGRAMDDVLEGFAPNYSLASVPVINRGSLIRGVFDGFATALIRFAALVPEERKALRENPKIRKAWALAQTGKPAQITDAAPQLLEAMYGEGSQKALLIAGWPFFKKFCNQLGHAGVVQQVLAWPGVGQAPEWWLALPENDKVIIAAEKAFLASCGAFFGRWVKGIKGYRAKDFIKPGLLRALKEPSPEAFGPLSFSRQYRRYHLYRLLRNNLSATKSKTAKQEITSSKISSPQSSYKRIVRKSSRANFAVFRQPGSSKSELVYDLVFEPLLGAASHTNAQRLMARLLESAYRRQKHKEDNQRRKRDHIRRLNGLFMAVSDADMKQLEAARKETFNRSSMKKIRMATGLPEPQPAEATQPKGLLLPPLDDFDTAAGMSGTEPSIADENHKSRLDGTSARIVVKRNSQLDQLLNRLHVRSNGAQKLVFNAQICRPANTVVLSADKPKRPNKSKSVPAAPATYGIAAE